MNNWIDLPSTTKGQRFRADRNAPASGKRRSRDPAYEEAIASCLHEIEVFLAENMNLIFERLVFMRLLKDH